MYLVHVDPVVAIYYLRYFAFMDISSNIDFHVCRSFVIAH